MSVYKIELGVTQDRRSSSLHYSPHIPLLRTVLVVVPLFVSLLLEHFQLILVSRIRFDLNRNLKMCYSIRSPSRRLRLMIIIRLC